MKFCLLCCSILWGCEWWLGMQNSSGEEDMGRPKLLCLLRVMLHQVVAVDSSACFQTRERASTFIVFAWSYRSLSWYFFCIQVFCCWRRHPLLLSQTEMKVSLWSSMEWVFPETRATLGVSCWWESLLTTWCTGSIPLVDVTKVAFQYSMKEGPPVLIMEILDRELLEDVSKWRPVMVTGVVPSLVHWQIV